MDVHFMINHKFEGVVCSKERKDGTLMPQLGDDKCLSRFSLRAVSKMFIVILVVNFIEPEFFGMYHHKSCKY